MEFSVYCAREESKRKWTAYETIEALKNIDFSLFLEDVTLNFLKLKRVLFGKDDCPVATFERDVKR